MNPNASEHNHDMMSPEEMVKAWPAEVNEMIIQLARQRLQTHEIREAVKQQFPDISWNERRFYNRLTEERKRIRQRGVVERSQRLLMLSARLCSVIASNEDWAMCVESDLQRMFENFCQLARLTPDNINTLVDLVPDMIQMDNTDRLVSNTHHLSIGGSPHHAAMAAVAASSSSAGADLEDEFMGSPAKKRRSFATRGGGAGNSTNNENAVIPKNASGGNTTSDTFTAAATQQKGIQMVYVPSYTIQVRSPLNRSCSESSTNSASGGGGSGSGRRGVFNENNSFLESQQQQQQQAFGSSSSFFSLASPTSSSSSSSSMPFQRHAQMTGTATSAPNSTGGGRMTSPQHSIHSPNEFIMSSHPSSYQTPQPHQQQQPNEDNNNYNTAVPTTTSAATVNSTNAYTTMQTSFSPYTIPTSAFTSPPELPFSFEPTNLMRNNTNHDNSSHTGEENNHTRRQQQQVYGGFFPNSVKEESNVEQQQQQMLQRQQQEYEQQRMHRNFSQQQQQQQQGYSLPPMIRSNEGNTTDNSNNPATTHWS